MITNDHHHQLAKPSSFIINQFEVGVKIEFHQTIRPILKPIWENYHIFFSLFCIFILRAIFFYASIYNIQYIYPSLYSLWSKSTQMLVSLSLSESIDRQDTQAKIRDMPWQTSARLLCSNWGLTCGWPSINQMSYLTLLTIGGRRPGTLFSDEKKSRISCFCRVFLLLNFMNISNCCVSSKFPVLNLRWGFFHKLDKTFSPFTNFTKVFINWY